MWRRAASLSPFISSSGSLIRNHQTAYNFKIWESFTTEIPTQVFAIIVQSTFARYIKSITVESFPISIKVGNLVLIILCSSVLWCMHKVKGGKGPFICFVLGGPGSGKGTQCAKIVKNYGLTHLSAGELLRREIASNSEYGTTILNTIKEGKIVPSEVTVSLIQKEMESSDSKKFLIDGFPRSEENRAAFERIMGAEPDIVLFFDCPEEEMVNRVLNRNEGRVDDNIDTVRKRLQVFKALNLPVINYYARRGKLYTINAVGTVDEIFEQVRAVFAALKPSLGLDIPGMESEMLWRPAFTSQGDDNFFVSVQALCF
ncbi:putative UMP-CMP kinase 2 [Citrus sinensis]|uniref:UMP-CMP kinase 2 n=1 Tax=Citrus sinensis TaxID=2711 RepID=A0ACB8HVH7_CITSI|nr:putative UMP-CMP kinase 2 [Citrus sinensis]